MDVMLLDSFTADKISENMPTDGALEKLVEFFSAFSDGTRLKILTALAASPMCVTDLSVITGLNQTTCSRQLRLLRTSGLVEAKRQGKVVFYSVAGGAFNCVMDIAVTAVLNA